MAECVWYWRASAVVAGVGVAVTALNFNPGEPMLLVGLTLCILGVVVANMGCVARKARSLDEEFEAGYRAGYRAGRRAPKLEKVTPIRRAQGGLSSFSKAVRDGRLQAAPVGPLPGDHPPARRSSSHAH